MIDERISRVTRPLNAKHEVVGLVAFLKTRDGLILQHYAGEAFELASIAESLSVAKKNQARRVKKG